MRESEQFNRYLCLDLARLPEVINAEAISVDRTVFLATHMPMSNISVERAPQQVSQLSEDGILQAVRDASDQDRHAFITVKGVPGTGKSHLIRWLKERITADPSAQERDVIILIERANNSLRGTLEQLLESGVFQGATTEQRLSRLRDATMPITKNQLSEMLLNGLQVASSDETPPHRLTLGRRILRSTPALLLDLSVRQHFKQQGGPIERIGTFLTAGLQTDTSFDQTPEFSAEDFAFPLRVRQEIRQQSHPAVKNLADDLADDLQIRENFARYLNVLLPFAIERAVSLTGDDLRSMFFDLRRQLRTESKGLILFIEDVTSFTGIDAALLDVLVTQHTGEANRELCRMTSVIGITDAFFADKVPDNVKDRMTHIVALWPATDAATQLGTPTAVGALVGRYLNALRTPTSELETWARTGAHPDHLPVFCDQCRFKETCHSSFGAVSYLPDGSDGRQMGLYPFNENALWTMFRHLDQSRVSLTPRSLLRSVVHYVLQSHGRDIESGEFPPASNRLGSEFQTPLLSKPLQDPTIEREAGMKAPSVRTLLQVWGNGTADSRGNETARQVGTLPGPVFRAFDLPFIAGEQVATDNYPPPTRVTTPVPPGNTPSPMHTARSTATTDEQDAVHTSSPPTLAQLTEEERDARAVAEWQRGQPLDRYGRMAERVGFFFRDALDWEVHGVAPELARERLKPGRVHFEGQTGQRRHEDQLVFQRSDTVVQALQSLLTLRSPDRAAAEQASVGGAIANLANWMRAEESRVVAFVRGISSPTTEPIPFSRTAVRVATGVAALRGVISPASASSVDLLFLDLIANRAPNRSADPTDQEWHQELQQLKSIFPTSWSSADNMRWKPVNAAMLSRTLRETLNVGRDSSSGDDDVLFFDVATAHDELSAFRSDAWRFDPAPSRTSSQEASGMVLLDGWRFLATYFHAGIAEANAQLAADRGHLVELIGQDRHEEIESAIQDVLQFLRDKQVPNRLGDVGHMRAQDIERAMKWLDLLVSAPGDVERAAILMTPEPGRNQAISTISRLQRFAEFLQEDTAVVEKELRKVGLDGSSEEILTAATVEVYDLTLGHLTATRTATGRLTS